MAEEVDLDAGIQPWPAEAYEVKEDGDHYADEVKEKGLIPFTGAPVEGDGYAGIGSA
jgi:hypothetical protein